MTTNPDNILLSAYLVVGTDELRRRHVIERMHKRMAALGDLDMNFDRFKGEEATGDQIVTACNTLPFASEARLVEVIDVDKLRKADSEQIVTYLQDPCATTVLLLVADKLAAGTRLRKAVQALGAKSVIECEPPKANKLAQITRQMAVTHGATITPGAASALVDLLGRNTVAIDSALKKLALAHRGNDPISEYEVMTSVFRTAEVKPWEFIDAFASRNLPTCFSLRTKMPDVSPHALIGMCTTRIRELLTVKALERRGEAAHLAKVLKLPEWRVRNHRKQARSFTSRELIEALRRSRDTEQAMKSGADPETAFMKFVVETLR